MIIPDCMDRESVMTCINNVIDRISPRYVFYGYPIQDIKQEAFMICMEALRRYDCSRPLENFLAVHLSNRLKNFIRDNHFLSKEDEKRVKVMQPAQLQNEDTIVDEKEKYSINYDRIDYSEMQKIVDSRLPASYRLDYLKLVNDVYISKTRREEITQLIEDILLEHGYEKR